MTLLDESFGRVKDKLQQIRGYRDRDGNWVDDFDLDGVVKLWCEEINQLWCEEINQPKPQEIINGLDGFLRDPNVIKWSYQIYKTLLIATNNRLMSVLSVVTKMPLEKISEKDFKENISETKKETISETKKETMGKIVLIGFVLTAIGIAIYFLHFLQKKKSSQKVQQPSRSASTEKYILLLVLDAERSETAVVQIRDNKRIKPAHARLLSSSSALQGMWYGKQSEFDRKGLGNIERNIEHGSSQMLPSEYDVYLIQIGLDEYDQGFARDSSSIDRLEAFERLANDNRYEVISVSQRLSGYSTDYLYR